jgi:hypothetical protein
MHRQQIAVLSPAQHHPTAQPRPAGYCPCNAPMQVCSALAQVAKHSADLAEVVVEAEVFPKVLASLAYPDETVAKHAATLVREVAKHTPELAQLVVANGGIGALVEFAIAAAGNNRQVRGALCIIVLAPAPPTLQHHCAQNRRRAVQHLWRKHRMCSKI